MKNVLTNSVVSKCKESPKNRLFYVNTEMYHEFLGTQVLVYLKGISCGSSTSGKYRLMELTPYVFYSFVSMLT